MKIVFITRKWPPAMGGMETYSRELHERLARSHDVQLHALAGNTDGSVPGARALLGFGLKTSVSLVVTRSDGDVIHAGDPAVWPLALLARLRSRRARVVIAAHGTDVSMALRPGALAKAYRVYLGLGRWMLPRVRVIANSVATERYARALGYVDVAVVPLGATLLEPSTTNTSKKTGKLLFAGRIMRLKGLKWFVENVLPKLPDGVELEVAGTIWDQEEASALEHPRVTYLGKLDQAALQSRMASALAVVIPNLAETPSTFEGFGLVAPEAAVAGGVVVASHVGGYESSVLDGETGFLLEPEDAHAWAKALTDIAAWSPERRATFTANARQVARAYFNWDRVAEETVTAYGVSAQP